MIYIIQSEHFGSPKNSEIYLFNPFWTLEKSCAGISKDLPVFLVLRQACTLARRNAEVFLKYIHRNSVTMANISGHNVTVSTVTGVTEVTGHSRVPEQQVKGWQKEKNVTHNIHLLSKYRV